MKNSNAVEEDLLLAETRHRLANNLQLIAGLVNVRLRVAEGDEAQRHLTALHEEINALAVVQQLLAGADSAPLADLLGASARLWDRLASDQDIEIFMDAEDGVEVGDTTAQSLALVVNELVTNALEHAYPDGGPGRIDICLSRRDMTWATLTVADDGRGPPKQSPCDRGSFGLSLVKRMTAGLGGRVEIGAGASGGTVVRLVFPVAPGRRQAS